MVHSTPSKTSSSLQRHNREQRKGSWRKLLLYLFSAALMVALVAGFWPKPTKVQTVSVVRSPLIVSILEEGKTRIRNRYVITPPVAGYLNRVTLRAGARVQARKTVLATIEAEASGFLDPRSRSEAQAHLNAVVALKMQREAEVNRASAALDLALKELDRADLLRKEEVISDQEWDDIEAREQVLSQELSSAKFALRVAEFEIEQAQAKLREVAVPDAEESIPLEITGSVDGFVLNVFEENARTVDAGTPIMEIGDPSDLEVELELLSTDAVGIEPGAEVTIEQWGGGVPMYGRVALVEPGGFTKVSALGVEEQRVKVRVDFLEPLPSDHKLGDRYRIEARIVTWRGDNVLQVPTGSLFRRGNDWMTFTVENGKARLRKVEITHNNGIAAEVVSGMEEGEIVIVYPPEGVADGVDVISDVHRAGG
ncbi:Uncharacterized protein SCG7086_AC_00170 [Chlamydiales bacterium SCGC AG-110-P3]|nr:Uncharacterized protein SCG7086_AC_00170 [Chlamydiales bacterium SCGC AG-110-P3]